MNTNIVEQYLTEQKILGSHTVYGGYAYYKEIAGDSRIGVCKVRLLTDKINLHVFIELPFRVNRGESREVFKELCLINDELEENQCYDLDVLSGAIRYHTMVDLPESVAEVAKIVDHSLEMVAEDYSTITQMIYEELIAVEKSFGDSDKMSNVGSEDEEDDQPVPPVKPVIAFRKGQWNEIGTGNTLSYNQFKNMLITSNNQVVVMEGPTGCGKTMMLKEIHEHGERKVVILSAEQIRDHFIHVITKKGYDSFQDTIEGCDIICMEDLDWTFKTKALQMETAFLVNKLCENALVVLNGIYCTERNTILLDHIHQPLRKFQFLGEAEDRHESEHWGKRYVSGDFIYDIQRDDSAMIVRYCGKDTIVDIPDELDGHPVTTLGEFSFWKCMSLQEVNCKRRHKRDLELTISSYAFSECDNLRMVFLHCDYVDIKENAFSGCSDLHTLQIDAWNCNIERFAFRGCSFLRNLEIDVSRYCFQYSVIEGVLYDAINRWLLHAPDITFSGVDHLNLPEGLLCIDDHAFEDCPNISYLHIPDSVITIGDDAFKGCENLKLLVYPESYAAKYAVANNIPFSYILKDDPSDTYLFE